ncbi:MAG: DUF1499 domain-containing protein [Burkholderiaceae bacterium]
MSIVGKLLYAAGGLAVGLLLAGRLGALGGVPPATLGVRDGRLAPPSDTPNSVSSQAGLYPQHPMRSQAAIAPLALVGGDGAATLARIEAIAAGTDGAQPIERRPDYLRYTYTSRVLRFVDDTEFWFDPAAGAVQVRSASRLGRRDFDVNRQRIEAIRTRLAAPA